MDFKSFLNRIKEIVDAGFPDGTMLEYKEITKNNGVEAVGAVLRHAGGASNSSMVYVDRIYRLMGGEEADPEIAAELIGLHLSGEIPDELTQFQLENWEDIRGRIILRLIGLEANRERLKELVNREYLDMALTCCIYFTGERIGHGITEITHRMAEEWGVSDEEILSAAEENTPKLMPETLRTLKEAAGIDSTGDDGLNRLFVLGNENILCGAAAILYSSSLKRLSGRFGCDLYILPTSLHEVILTPVEGADPDFLREALQNVNASEVPQEDVLTQTLYRYYASEDRIGFA